MLALSAAPAACGHLRLCKLPWLQVCFLALQGGCKPEGLQVLQGKTLSVQSKIEATSRFFKAWQSVDFVNALKRKTPAAASSACFICFCLPVGAPSKPNFLICGFTMAHGSGAKGIYWNAILRWNTSSSAPNSQKALFFSQKVAMERVPKPCPFRAHSGRPFSSKAIMPSKLFCTCSMKAG